MNPLVKFIQKKFSDTTIRTIRIVFALVYIGALYYNFFAQTPANIIQDEIFWFISLSEQARFIIQCVMIAFGFIPLITGITNICIAKSKYIRIAQIVYAIIIMYFGSIIVEGSNLDVDVLIFLMGFIPLFGGITGKFITNKCRNYGYKVTKIRV